MQEGQVMELDINLFEKNETSKIIVSEKAFSSKFKEDLVRQVVNAYLSGGRAGTKSQKTRREISGGGIKPWRQKGTGRARAGSNRSPLWRSGGVTFAARPRNFSQKVNRKMYRNAIASILSELIRQKRLTVVSKLKLNEPKTRELRKLLKKLNLKEVAVNRTNILIIIDGYDRNIDLASRNMVGIFVCNALRIDPVSLIASEHVVVTTDGLAKLEERLS